VCINLGWINQKQIAAGRADDIAPDALADADRAYELLRSGP
jgi:hypothetical protein